ncbi:MAG: 3'-5' exonuclease [Gemmatimonadaceae bacterium]
MDLTRTRGVYAEPEDTLLTSRAADYLAAGPADVVDLIGHVCSLPGAPRIVAEHMAQAMFSGRTEFVKNPDGRWMIVHPPVQPYTSFDEFAAARGVARASKGKRRPKIADGRLSDPLRDLSYVVVDVETTGGQSYLHDRITEIACVVVRNGEIVELFETLVNPKRSISPFVTQLTNITAAMVEHAPTFDRIASDVMRVLQGHVFVAHNANFDWRFITSELSRASGHKLRGRRLCTVKLARKVVPQLPRRSLDHLARYYGVEITNRHRAGGDALATARCLIRMLSDLSDRGCATWDDLDVLLARPAGRKKKRRSLLALPTSVTHDTTA